MRRALPVMALLALAAPQLVRAQDVLAEYWANAGSLPPEYAWEVTVSIGTDGKVLLRHCKGYATEGPGCQTRKGQADAAALQAIRDAVSTSGLVETPARTEPDPPIGGGATGGAVWVDGEKVNLPPFPVAEDADRVDDVVAAVKAAIPPRLVRKFIDGN